MPTKKAYTIAEALSDPSVRIIVQRALLAKWLEIIKKGDHYIAEGNNADVLAERFERFVEKQENHQVVVPLEDHETLEQLARRIYEDQPKAAA